MLLRLLRIGLVFLGLALLLGGIILLGEWARNDVKNQERFQVPFSSIACQPEAPPGMKPHEFLDEIQYLGRFRPEIPILDRALPSQLEKAFGLHPWVRKVKDIQILPGQKIQVRLEFRRPALVVPWAGQDRVVDREGILLPTNATPVGLPRYQGIPQGPKGPAGTSWGDSNIREAARKAASRD